MQFSPVFYFLGVLMPKYLPQRRSSVLDFDVTVLEIFLMLFLTALS
jgi:hypothetical protein